MAKKNTIIKALKNLGGIATLNQIYDECLKLDSEVCANEKQSIQALLEQYSSDSKVHYSTGQKQDIFYKIKEKEIFWGLREKSLNSFNPQIIAELLEKYDSWRADYGRGFDKHFNDSYKLVDDFLKKYPLEKVKTLPIEEYVVGLGKETFCWWVENKLDSLGDIRPRQLTSFQKFGIDYDKNTKKYRIGGKKVNKTRFGSTPEEIFENIKKDIVNVVEGSLEGNYDAVAESQLNGLFGNKISYLYNREQFLPIYSDGDLNILLSLFEIPFSIKENRAYKRKKLFDFYKALNRSDITPLMFMSFVYNVAGYRSYLRSEENVQLKTDIEIKNYVLVDIGETESYESSKKTSRSGLIEEKAESLASKKISGKKGEEIVKDYLLKHKKDLDIKSLYFACDENDYAHFDISYEKSNGETIYIEVKSTKSNRDGIVGFEMSDAEYAFMEEHFDNYFVFYVNDVFGGDKILRIPASKIFTKPSKYKALFKFGLK